MVPDGRLTGDANIIGKAPPEYNASIPTITIVRLPPTWPN
jgi:hypothetical protein